VSPTGGESGRVRAEVLGQLYRWNEEKGLGVVFDAATGFRLPDGAVFSPDAAFVRKERWLPSARRSGKAFHPWPPMWSLRCAQGAMTRRSFGRRPGST
jgi:Uma2 family endonuclease